jgi:hypothetical protein
VQGSGIARPGFASRQKQVGRFKTVAKRAEPDRLGAVLALVVGDLARTWISSNAGEDRRSRLGSRSGFQPTSEESRWKPWVGVDGRAPLVHEPTGQIIRIQRNDAGRPPFARERLTN